MSLLSEQKRRTVQLRHTLPDGTSHIDWMIAPDEAGREPLMSFRIDRRLDTLAGGEQVAARRIADHRPAYLEYEGPVSPDRGSVARIANGIVMREWGEVSLRRFEIYWCISGEDMEVHQHLVVQRMKEGDDAWQISCESAEPIGR